MSTHRATNQPEANGLSEEVDAGTAEHYWLLKSASGASGGSPEAAPLDNETDFDDEQDDDQLPLDLAEARESGALLDDPESMAGGA